VFADGSGVICRAWNLIEGKELEEASRIILELQASDSDSHSNAGIQSLANALARAYYVRGGSAEGRGEYRDAIADYESSLQRNSRFARAHNRLARLLSTCHEDEVRDGVRAVEHATRACELTEPKDTSYLTTLAAAHAEAGDFHSAVNCQRQAIELLGPDETGGLQNYYEMRLRLYESGQPYHRSMIARWTFDQSNNKSIPESSGNGLNGRLVGDAHVVEVPDRPGKVLCLDGEGDWVDCGDDMRLNVVSEITVACWIKVFKFDKQHQTIVSKGNNAWRLARAQNADSIEFACTGLTVADNVYGAVYGTMNVNDNQWHHVVGVYDGMTIRLYVDGELDVSSETSGNINANSCKVLIGENEDPLSGKGRDRAFNGLLDDVRIYDYALTETEIKALYGREQIETREEVTTDTHR